MKFKKQKQEAATAANALTGAVLAGAASPTRVKFPAIKNVSGPTAAKLKDFLEDVGRARERQGEEGAEELPEKVDLKDLSWEDRERVLRLLFAKINNVQAGGPKSSPRGQNAGMAAMQAAEAAGLRMATPEGEGKGRSCIPCMFRFSRGCLLSTAGFTVAGMGAPFGLTPALPSGINSMGEWAGDEEEEGTEEEIQYRNEPGFRPFPGSTAASRPEMV